MTASVISDLSNSTSYDGLMKDVYLRGLTSTAFNSTQFMRLIRKMGPGDIKYEGQRVKHVFSTQRSAGFGAFPEGGTFVDPVPIKGQQVHEFCKYLNSYIELSGPLIAAASSDRGSFVSAVTQYFRTNMDAARLQVERMAMGSGDGKLALVKETGVGQTEIDVSGSAFFDTQFLEPGQWVEFRQVPSSDMALRSDTINSLTYGQIASTSEGTKKSGATDYGTITFDDIVVTGGSSHIVDGDYVCAKGLYKTTAAAQPDPGTTWYDKINEINGLNNLVSDGVNNSETEGNYTSIWHTSRSSNTWLKSLTADYDDLELDESDLLTDLIQIRTQRQANPNLIVCGPRMQKDYFENSVQGTFERRFNVIGDMDWVGGYKGVGVQIGPNRLMLTAVDSCPSGTIFIINTKDFAFTTMTNGFKYVLGDGQNALQQSHSDDTKFASAVNYVQFVCFDPRKQFKGYNVKETG